jgi:hypothetical protein
VAESPPGRNAPPWRTCATVRLKKPAAAVYRSNGLPGINSRLETARKVAPAAARKPKNSIVK